MNEANPKSAVELELKRLEKRLEDLIATVSQIKEENRALRQRQETLTAERATLAAEERAGSCARRGDDRAAEIDGAGMSDNQARVSVRILEKEYHITCPMEERSDLLDSAEFLNSKMREIRDSGKVVGLDRIAVIAALNMANELIRFRNRDSQSRFGRGRTLAYPARARRVGLGEGSAARALSVSTRSEFKFGAACGVRCGSGYLLTLICKPQGPLLAGSIVQVRLERKALSVGS